MFGHFKVPLIGYLKPRLISITDEMLVIELKINRRSKNHLNSMYFGALAIGADLAGGLHGFYHARRAQVKVSLAFKSFEAQFLRRPESDVFFVCTMGKVVEGMIAESKKSGERINKCLDIKAYTNYPKNPEEVATFNLELSLKVVSPS
jgi:acyl-coenzyme A thioesterase PaaI-like protein